MSGLSSSQLARLRQKYGKNELKATNIYPLWRKLLDQFTDLMVIILILSAGIAIFMGWYQENQTGLIDGLVILGIVILNAGIGFFQEYKTERALEALKKLIAPHAIVIRDGKKQQIKAEEIVPGDIVVLSPGDKVVADGKLVQSSELRVDESSLTGESIPVGKSNKEEVFMGTAIVAGTAHMRVIAIGMETRFGRIAHLTTETVRDKSPLQKELLNIGIFVTQVTVIISAILILVGIFIQGQGFLESLLFAVSVAVAAVPEGLPATITVALALGVQNMIKKNAVVKKLSSIETLGSTTVICSDKTGTLTRNEMTVTRLLLGLDQIVEVGGAGYDPGKGFIECPTRGFQKDNLEKIRLISSYCTEAELQKKGGRYQILGDPTEGALITLSRKRMVEERKALKVQRLKILETIPFDSERKLMSVVTDGKERHLLTKGSPDELLTRCTHVLVDGKVKPFSSLQKKKVQHSLESMASDALRLIGFAYRPLKTTENPRAKEGKQKPLQLEKNLIFVGLAGMIDPPREEVPRAVGLTHKAGIRSIIITGDHGLTAKAIALKIGMATDETPVITGSELEKMKDRQLDKVLKTKGPLIFSRVSPEHKRRIVDRLKHLGEVVAVTGDGVNDAPALKRADLGIAMGITGTEVAKETAHMILLDDSYATIVTAVSEGRKIYGNLRKFTWFIFSCNIGELLTVFSAILLQIPVPLTASLILAVNLGTDILPGIALGVDHAEPNVMNKPPRDPKARIMNRSFVTHFVLVGLFVGAVVVGVYLFRLSTLGWAWGEHLDMLDPIHIQASTLAFATLVVIQLFNAFNARSFTYSVFRLRTLKPLWGAVTASVALVLAIIYLPFFQNIFHTTGLSLSEWFMVIGAGLMVLIVEELRKLIFTNHGESR